MEKINIHVSNSGTLGHANLINGFWSKEMSKMKQGTRSFLSKPPIGVVNFNTKLSSTSIVKHLTEYKLGIKTLKSV